MKFLWHVVVLAAFVVAMALAQDAPKKVTKVEALNAAVTKVQPDYPNMAKQLKIHGVVELEVVVTETGSVGKVQILSGNPVLTAPAAQAVKLWKFKPFMEDGKAVPVLAPISLDFKL